MAMEIVDVVRDWGFADVESGWMSMTFEGCLMVEMDG